MRRGFTLLEIVVTLSIAGLILGLALPRLGEMLDRVAVTSAAGEIAAAHSRARVVAVTESRVSLLLVRPDSLILLVIEDTDTVPRWAGPGPAAAGVGLSGPARPLLLAPTGVGFGVSNATYTVSRGRAARQVIVSRWGRVRIVP